jgi:hypothetical protein
MKSLSPTLARLVLWAFVACAELRVMEPRRSLLACGVRGARWRVLSALGRERAPAPHCRRASAAAAAAASARAASRGNSGCIFAHLLRAATRAASSRIYFAQLLLGLHLRSIYSGCIYFAQLLLGLHLRSIYSGCIYFAQLLLGAGAFDRVPRLISWVFFYFMLYS